MWIFRCTVPTSHVCIIEHALWLLWWLNTHILVPRARRFLVTWSWNEGLWKQPLADVRKFLTCGHASTEVKNITAHAHNGFCPSSLLWGKNFTSWALSREWLPWAVFTQLGFIDNFKSQKEKTLTKTSWTHCWVAELKQLIGRLSSEFNMLVHRLAKTNTGKARGILFHVMSCKRYLISKRLLKRNNSCVVLFKWTGK